MDATRILIFDAVRAIQSPIIRDGQDRNGANVEIPTGDVQHRQALVAEARSLAHPTERFWTICEAILIIIDEEDYAYPLSDTQFAKKLAAQGIPIAHRTVSKYRDRVTTLRVFAS